MLVSIRALLLQLLFNSLLFCLSALLESPPPGAAATAPPAQKWPPPQGPEGADSPGAPQNAPAGHGVQPGARPVHGEALQRDVAVAFEHGEEHLLGGLGHGLPRRLGLLEAGRVERRVEHHGHRPRTVRMGSLPPLFVSALRRRAT